MGEDVNPYGKTFIEGDEEYSGTIFQPGESIPIEKELELIEIIGVGGMGEVWKAVQRSSGIEKIVAAKVHPPGEEHLEKMRQEVSRAINLDHRSIARVEGLSVREHEGSSHGIIVMEYVEGTPLSDVILRHNSLGLHFPQKLSAFIGWLSCEALDYAHRKNVIHRDIKPSNLMLGSDGDLKIIDFGLAIDSSSQDFEKEKGFSGTMAYISPEQLNNEALDPRSDLYSLGMTLYELLNGESAVSHFSSGSGDFNAMYEAKMKMDNSAPLKVEGVDAPFSRSISIATNSNRQRRYGSAKEMQNDLTSYLYEGPKGILSRISRRSFLGPTRDAMKLYRGIINDPQMDSLILDVVKGEKPEIFHELKDKVEEAKRKMSYMVRRRKFCLETLPNLKYPGIIDGKYLPIG